MALDKNKRVTLLAMIFLSLLPFPSSANLAQFVHVRETLFWDKLYTEDYHTLYCAIQKKAGQETQVSHVYPTAWMANAMYCSAEEDCDYARYKDASSDLHNMWPVVPAVSAIRRHYVFLEGEEETGQKQDCNIVIYARGMEPRQWAKGEIARSILYIIWKYRLPDYEQLPTLLKWAKTYPVTAEEKWRNVRIIELQRNDNPFISNPGFIDEVFAGINITQ